VNRLGLQGNGALESFQKGEVLGDIIVLTPDPLGDSDLTALGIVDDNANTGGPRIPQGSTIDVSHQIRHRYASKMLKKGTLVKHLTWFHRKKCLA
jgi:hypothetical protein